MLSFLWISEHFFAVHPNYQLIYGFDHLNSSTQIIVEAQCAPISDKLQAFTAFSPAFALSVRKYIAVDVCCMNEAINNFALALFTWLMESIKVYSYFGKDVVHRSKQLPTA